MNTHLASAALLVLLPLVAVDASAQSTSSSIGVGADLMIPVGSFADHWGTGYGATAEFDHTLEKRFAFTVKAGYLTWSAKNLSSGVSARYGGVPALVGIKWYPSFIPQGSARFYGHLEAGAMIASVTGSGRTLTLTKSTTDITISPSVGFEAKAGDNGAVDISARYFDISKKSSIGVRLGYKWNL
jgi:hypothetical protein